MSEGEFVEIRYEGLVGYENQIDPKRWDQIGVVLEDGFELWLYEKDFRLGEYDPKDRYKKVIRVKEFVFKWLKENGHVRVQSV